MPKPILTALISSVFAISSCTAGAQVVSPKNCAHDRTRLLALDEDQFDQNMSGGWRELSYKQGCALVAADLLHDYREAHHVTSGLLFWHEAQVRASAGQSAEAISLMQRAYKPAEEDKAGWNPYVEATIAFLRRDKAAFEQAKSKLNAVQPPVGAGAPPVINGFMEAEFADGSTRKIRWPINMDVVEGLENCFDKPYYEAYKDVCRQRKH